MWNWNKERVKEEPQVQESVGVQLIRKHICQFVEEIGELLRDFTFPPLTKRVEHTSTFEHYQEGAFHKIVDKGTTIYCLDLGPLHSRVKQILVALNLEGTTIKGIDSIEAQDGKLCQRGFDILTFQIFSDGQVCYREKNKFQNYNLNDPANVKRLEQFLANLRIRMESKIHTLEKQENQVVDLAINFDIGNRGY